MKYECSYYGKKANLTLILISSCLAGFNVRYDGSNAKNELASWLVRHGQAITICPEIMSGFETPRRPSEIVGGTARDVINGIASVQENNGTDVTEPYIMGANLVLKIAKEHHIKAAFLKDSSPSCGSHYVYNGTFTGKKLVGKGITAELLSQYGVQTFPDDVLSIDTVMPFIDRSAQFLLKKYS